MRHQYAVPGDSFPGFLNVGETVQARRQPEILAEANEWPATPVGPQPEKASPARPAPRRRPKSRRATQ
jgi:hypothetical protein